MMRLGLQIGLVLASLIPFGFAITGALYGADRWMAGEAVMPGLDNQYRYLSTYYLSLTFLLWWIIPNIERHATVLRILTFVLFLGGLARLWSMLQVGPGTEAQMVGMVAELCAPLLAVWQWFVAREHDGRDA